MEFLVRDIGGVPLLLLLLGLVGLLLRNVADVASFCSSLLGFFCILSDICDVTLQLLVAPFGVDVLLGLVEGAVSETVTGMVCCFLAFVVVVSLLLGRLRAYVVALVTGLVEWFHTGSGTVDLLVVSLAANNHLAVGAWSPM